MWYQWSSTVKQYCEPIQFYFHNIFVPTYRSVLYHDLLEHLSLSSPVLLVGDSGVAKTTTVENFIATLPKRIYDKLTLCISYKTTSKEVQTRIQSCIEKRSGCTFGAPAGNKLMVFLYDMHMPQVDKYGTQQPLGLIQTLFDHGFM